MTGATRRTLDRMECPTCHREVAFRLIRMGGARMPGMGIRKPVRHQRTIRWDGLVEVKAWCPAGEP